MAFRVFGPESVRVVYWKPGTEFPLDDLNKVIHQAFEQGLLILGSGESTVRLMPPLIVDREQADCALGILERCVEEAGTRE